MQYRTEADYLDKDIIYEQISSTNIFRNRLFLKYMKLVPTQGKV